MIWCSLYVLGEQSKAIIHWVLTTRIYQSTQSTWLHGYTSYLKNQRPIIKCIIIIWISLYCTCIPENEKINKLRISIQAKYIKPKTF